ncbi:MAG TPA: CPBP family intramembrane glutamic endopeptidase [Gemmatimonadaceae bacterium]|nr:CPBP family intramembrane glutamic endopeptidase [Gemmatimonadaceae bacterium]
MEYSIWMDALSRGTRVALLLAGIALGAGSLAVWLFPRALPTVVIENRISRQDAQRRADAFFRTHGIAPPLARTAIRFRQDASLLTFVDLAGGGKDTLDALVRGSDVAPFTWSVRTFVPRDPHEARVHFAPDGRVVGFQRRLAEADVRPALAADSAARIAERVLVDWLGDSPARWRLVTSSYETRKTSGRVDRTFTFERPGRTIAGAPIRLDIVIAGDLPSLARPYVVIPESFQRRYGEMRSANGLLSLIDSIGILAIVVLALVALRRYSREGRVRWRAALMAGSVIGALLVAAGINELASNWFDYDTATSPLVFQTINVASALGASLAMGAVIAVTLAAAEALERAAFPDHLDWWKLWKYRGSHEVAGRVAGGYAVALVGLAYVTVFYLVTRRFLGWWVPTEMLDDPNQIATSLPWLGGIALSLQAGVWEEALFRAIPLSFLSLWVGTRPRRSLWMAAGVMATALVFGFGHASYPSWPPYSRGIEIFLDACLWAVLFLRFGIVVTVVAHFAYDLILFGLFAATGRALEYRVTAAVILLALFAPALAVAWRWVKQRGLVAAPGEARAGAWIGVDESEPPRAKEVPATRAFGRRSRAIALGIAAVGVLAALVVPAAPILGPPFTVGRERAIALTDSILHARGVEPAPWRRLARTASATDTAATWPDFLRAEKSERLAGTLAATYAVPAAWIVRYVRTKGPLAAREEEWRVRLRPNGALFDVRHIVPDSAPGATLSADEARRVAHDALVRAGIDTASLREAKLDETARPARRDVTITYVDSATPLPGGARALVWVSLAGREPVLVRRGVELPERFLREERDRQSARFAVALICGIGLVAFVAVGGTIVTRRRPVLVDDVRAGRRALLLAVAGLAAVQVAGSINGLPLTLFGYNTAVPWATFLGSTWIAIGLSVVAALIIAGFWLSMNALRRRAGIPILPDGAAGATAGGALAAGVALGSLFAMPGLLSALAVSGIPDPPHTLLDVAVPWITEALRIPMRAATIVPLIAIPALVVTGLTNRRSLRLVLVVLLIGLGVGAALPLTGSGAGMSAAAALLFLAIAVAVLAAIRAWGGVCVLAWVAAALTERALTSVHFALHAPTGAEQVAGGFGALVALALLAFLGRRLRT